MTGPVGHWDDVAVTNPISRGTLISLTKGMLATLQGSAPASPEGIVGVLGTSLDGGSSWTSVHTVVNSSDMTTEANVSPAPASGQKLVLTDLLVSVDTAMSVTIKEETSGDVVHGPFYMAANSVVQLTTRSKMSKLETADKKLQAVASVSGNITVETWVYSEA